VIGLGLGLSLWGSTVGHPEQQLGFLSVSGLDHATGSRNIKPEVLFKVQKMARYVSFCLIMGSFKGGSAYFCQIMARYG